MYALTSAIAKPLTGNGRWVSVSIGGVGMSTLFSTYEKIYAVLTNSFLSHPVSLDLENIRGTTGGLNTTFSAFLTANGNTTLPTSNTIPTLNPRYAKYADAFHAGYKVIPVHPTAGIDADLPREDKTWLCLQHPTVDYPTFYKYCLVNVNGFFHLTDLAETGIYVKEGMKSNFVSKQNQIGIYSFQNIGELHFIPITEDMIYKQNEQRLYKHRCNIDLGIDVTNKTVMLVLGGYLHVMDKKTFYQVGVSTFAIDFLNLPLFDRYYESRDYIDLSTLPIEHTSRNASQIDVQNFLRDDNLKAYLTLPQSFFVVLDNNDIFIDREFVKTCPGPGMLTSYTPPVYPLVLGVGRMANYWYTYEDKQYSITCWDSSRANRVYNTVDPLTQTCISDNRISTAPTFYSPAFFLKIGTDL